MKLPYIIRYLLTAIFAMGSLMGCIDSFEAETSDSGNILVIDARITNHESTQVVFLSRTVAFGTDTLYTVSGASVFLESESGPQYEFQEHEAGEYRSSQVLGLTGGSRYRLAVRTTDGREYYSSFERMPDQIPISEVKIVRDINGLQQEGVSVLVSNQGRSENSGAYRYAYEETYKVVPPFYNPFEWGEVDYTFDDGDGWGVAVEPRAVDVSICYATNESTDIILANTANLGENRIVNFPIRFIGKDNYIIAHRYSILVRQFHQSPEAHSFYSTLEDFSSSESIFNTIQPGFLEGNMRAADGGMVVGYFELSSYSEQRVFFSYEDLFPGEDLPPYLTNCATGAPPLYPEGFHIGPDGVLDGVTGSPLLDAIQANLIAYHAENEDFEDYIEREGRLGGAAPYLTKPLSCVDCTAVGSTEIPEFWIE
ncbi:DUF4249 domain-containing protein [Robiginitalea aurantiaca]|uniref:DUF4249 domain-containing protein n=1 Tax=Robiginitalea aurantiaca TaxID=3056915 RepID=A0ABT7WGT7_9FLAO|nr:DUF4249 domain-containing protein [Robiginitalea aurantiaca]MDM9632132.1 DUF4249 domain-containing protein [Robiginitalea aurantiaca]